jgi:hypothetical protein
MDTGHCTGLCRQYLDSLPYQRLTFVRCQPIEAIHLLNLAALMLQPINGDLRGDVEAAGDF